MPRVYVREALIPETLIWTVKELRHLWSVRPIVLAVIQLF